MSSADSAAAPAAHPALNIRKYLAASSLALQLRLREPALLLARCAFYLTILLIFSRLWPALLARDPNARPGELLWYVAVTEWVTLAQPHFYMDIERDVRGGEIAYHLTRPISYLTLKLCEGFSTMLLALVLLAAPGVLGSWLLTGIAPQPHPAMALLIVAGLLGGCFLLLCNALIGLSAFWLQDCAPAYWIWQKALFVLGGLFVPLDFYPGWLRDIALWSPFSAALYAPAQLLFHPDLGSGGALCARLLAWNGLCAVMCALIYRRALRIIDLNGG